MLKNSDIHIRDPFVLPVASEKRYYLYGTTGAQAWTSAATGFDYYVGSDLQHWEGPFPAFRPPTYFWADRNFWAPEVHLYQGRYYMAASFKAEGACRGTQILVADSAQGPFIPLSDTPVTPRDWECLDGTLYVDAEKQPWIVFCHEWVQVGDGEVCALRLSADLKTAVDQPRLAVPCFRSIVGAGNQLEGQEGLCHGRSISAPADERRPDHALVELRYWRLHGRGGALDFGRHSWSVGAVARAALSW